MIRRSHFALALFLIATVAFIACGRGGDEPTPAPAAPTATSVPMPVPVSIAAPAPATTTPITLPARSPEPTLPPAPTQALAPTASSTPIAGLNGGSAPADQVSLRPSEAELPTVEVVKVLAPSVVQVVTESVRTGMFNQPTPARGVGTGVILDKAGHILTNNHVIAGAERVNVTLSNDDIFPAEVIGGDPTTDLAVIRIDADGLVPAKLGNSSELQVGEDVIAIGHALGLKGGPTVSKGVVSALGRALDTGQQSTIVDLIQTDAMINPGNSGGPLVNSRAEVIGINTAIRRDSQGIGFAINIDDAKLVISQLMERGYVERGFLGITPVNLTPGIARQFDLDVTEGILLARVITGNAADEAGLRMDDIIVQLGDETIANTGELSKFLIANLPGETVNLVYFRGKTKITTEITLGTRPNG